MDANKQIGTIMNFNPLQNYNQGFAAARQVRDADLKKKDEQRLLQQRQSAVDAGLQSDAFKSLLAEQPNFALALKKEFSTDDQGLSAMVEDSAMIKYLLETDTTGESAMQLLQNRKQTIDNGALGQGRNSFHTDRAISVLQDEGPQALLTNMNKMLDIPNQLGKQKTESKTAEAKNFEKRAEIERSGTPEQLMVFDKLLGLQKDPKLSNKAEKAIIDSQDAYFSAGESARKMELLADDVGRRDIGGGLAATASETLKDILGSQDEVTNLRKRFNAIRASQSVTNLPPGPASDKDIALALSGFPKETANASQIISFLRGQAKLARIDEKYNEFKAEFIAENNSVKGLIKEWKLKLSDPDFTSGILSPKDNLKSVQGGLNVSELSDDDLFN